MFPVPLAIAAGPPLGLLVIDLQPAPGGSVSGVEPQLVTRPDGTTGLRVLQYRTDGRVDVYREPGAPVDSTLGDGLGEVADVEFARAVLELGPGALDADVEFCPPGGARTRVRVRQAPLRGRTFTFLAPVGVGVADPDKLFCVVMRRFGMLRRAGAVCEVEVGGVVRRVSSFPPLLDGRRMAMVRFSPDSVVGDLNPDGFRAALVAPDGVTESGGTRHLVRDGVVRRLSAGVGDREVHLELEPGLPDVSALAEGATRGTGWRFVVAGVEVAAGHLRATGRDGGTALELTVTRGWRPRGVPFGMRLVTWLLPGFCRWPTTYRWDGRLRDGEVTGGWRRTAEPPYTLARRRARGPAPTRQGKA